jgi:hypothetical protein
MFLNYNLRQLKARPDPDNSDSRRLNLTGLVGLKAVAMFSENYA